MKKNMDPSSASDATLCSKCGKRTATHYICYGGTGKSVELCDECMISGDSVAAAFTAEAKSARCVYCGGFPCCGGTDSLSQLLGGPAENRWMCLSCAPEYYSVFQTEIAKIAGVSKLEQLEEIRRIGVAMDKHMSEFVRRRDN